MRVSPESEPEYIIGEQAKRAAALAQIAEIRADLERVIEKTEKLLDLDTVAFASPKSSYETGSLEDSEAYRWARNIAQRLRGVSQALSTLAKLVEQGR
jgi:hypothetical protein